MLEKVSLRLKMFTDASKSLATTINGGTEAKTLTDNPTTIEQPTKETAVEPVNTEKTVTKLTILNCNAILQMYSGDYGRLSALEHLVAKQNEQLTRGATK